MSETLKALIEKYGILMDHHDVAKELGVIPATVVDMIGREDIRAKKVVRKWIVTTEEFEKFITTGKQKKERPSFREKDGYQKLVSLR